MKDEIKGKLEDIVLKKLRAFETTDDPEERKILIREIADLCEMKNNEEKINLQYDSSFREDMKQAEEMQNSKKDRIVKILTTLLEVMSPLVFYGIWMNRGFKFEEKGTYSSPTFRGLIKFFKPTKR